MTRESYLDAADLPVANKDGAAVIVSEYDGDGKVSATLKYDPEGNLLEEAK